MTNKLSQQRCSPLIMPTTGTSWPHGSASCWTLFSQQIRHNIRLCSLSTASTLTFLRKNTTKKIQAGCGVSTSELAYVDVRSLGKYAHDDAAYTNHLDGKSSVIRDK